MSDASGEALLQGRFGTYTITRADRQGVLAYRLALLAIALTFAAGVLVTVVGAPGTLLNFLWIGFCLALAVALATVHIYMVLLHRTLWLLWAIGSLGSLVLAFLRPEPLFPGAWNDPLALVISGFVFAALTGLSIKESFCFGWWETALTALVLPVLILGHLFGLIGPAVAAVLATLAALALLSVAVRKFSTPVGEDIGDKTVHAYLRGELQA
jgi:uncharacterized integral membrane protein